MLSRPSLSRIVLICIDAVHEKVVKLVETQPYLTSSVAEVQAKFVEPLARCGVIEKLESLCDRVTYPKWMMLNKTLREEVQQRIHKFMALLTTLALSRQANALNAFSPDALRVIDVACVWTYHLDCMTSGQMFSREDPGFINHTTSAAPCVLQRYARRRFVNKRAVFHAHHYKRCYFKRCVEQNQPNVFVRHGKP